MSLLYIIREGLTGIGRSKMPFMISVFSVTLALLIVGVGTLAVDNGLQFIRDLQADYDLEVFLTNDAQTTDKRVIADVIASFPGVIRMDYLSKDDAAELYNKEFGEDVLSLLDDNPLPSSFRVTFEEAHRHAIFIQAFIQTVEGQKGVDEVIFKKDLFDRIQGIMKMIYVVAASILFLLILSTVFLTANNLRLMILARYDLIETIRLLGAGDFIIKAPFFLEGGIIGFIGGLAAILMIALLEWCLAYFQIVDLPVRIWDYPEVMLGLLLFGVSLASIGVLKAVRRMLRYVS